MFIKPPYPILTWERNTERRCAAGEPSILLYWPSNNDFMLRLVNRLSRLSPAQLVGTTYEAPLTKE